VDVLAGAEVDVGIVERVLVHGSQQVSSRLDRDEVGIDGLRQRQLLACPPVDDVLPRRHIQHSRHHGVGQRNLVPGARVTDPSDGRRVDVSAQSLQHGRPSCHLIGIETRADEALGQGVGKTDPRTAVRVVGYESPRLRVVVTALDRRTYTVLLFQM